MQMRKILITSLLVMLASLPACSIYKPDIQQGNVLEKKTIADLKIGMTKRQVNFLMGTALLKDPFHKNRWDYLHTFKPADGEMTRQRITLFFENDLLVRIDDSGLNKALLK